MPVDWNQYARMESSVLVPSRARARGVVLLVLLVVAAAGSPKGLFGVDTGNEDTFAARVRAEAAGVDMGIPPLCLPGIPVLLYHGRLEVFKVTVQKQIDRWIDARPSRTAPRTLEQYRDIARRHILPAVGDRKLSKLRTKHVDALLTGLSDRPRTAQLVRMIIRAALAAAVEAGEIDVNPTDKAQVVQYAAEDPIWWTPFEVREFIDVAKARGDRNLRVWQLALCTGLRRGELIGLRWQDVRPDGIHVCNQRTLVAGKLVDAVPKTRCSRRVIPMTPELAALVDEMRRERPKRRRISPYVVDFTPQGIRKALKRAVEASGVRDIKIHGLRHTAASMAVRRGVPLRVVQDLLGHASYAITAKYYAHVAVDQVAAAVATLTRDVL
jgi:integrase